MQQIPSKPTVEYLYIRAVLSMIISQTEGIIRRKRDEKLRTFIASSRYKRKRIVQIKLGVFGVDQERERQRTIEKYERKCEIYIEKKTNDYNKRCENEVKKFNEQPTKKPTSNFIAHNKLLGKLLVLLQYLARLRDSDLYWFGYCISCLRKIHYKDANWWHYISKIFKSVCCDLFNINLQCPECNLKMSQWDQEVTEKYRNNLIKKHWIEVVLSLENKKHQEMVNPAKYWHLTTDFITEEMECQTLVAKQMLSEKLS